MIFGYYSLLILVLTIIGPFLLLSKKARAGLGHKLGVVPAWLDTDKKRARAWFHAVSVGEFNALLPLIEEFSRRHPEFELFVSTTTGTGQALAKSKVGSIAGVFHFPLDLPWATGNFINAIKPDFVAIVETEIWPGFMNQCHKRKIPVILINGRLSPRSFKSYCRWGWFFGNVFRQFAALAVQSEEEAKRFYQLAGKKINLAVCGNLKFDGLKAISTETRMSLRQKLGLAENEQVLVAGSTHEQEEAALLKAIKGEKIRLILAPRHPERFDRVVAILEARGFRPRKFSKNESFEQENDVYLLDTIGQLNNFYSVSTIAFVGGTLVPVGGHNLSEPCIYKVPVLCGPYVHKTKYLADCLQAQGALYLVQDEFELAERLHELKVSPELCQQMGTAGFDWLAQSQGAVERTIVLIEQTIGTQAKPEPLKIGALSGSQS